MNQFGSANPANSQICAQCEALLMDVLDRTATLADQAFFDRHLASCTSCSRMFIDAKRGGAWLEMLRDPRPVPSTALFERILAQTSGAQIIGAQTSAVEAGAGTAVEAVGVDEAGAPPNLFPGAVPATNYPGGFIPGAPLGGPPNPAPGAFLYGRPGPGVTGYPGAAGYQGAKVLPFRLRSAFQSIGQTMLQPRLAMTAAMAFFSIALTMNLTGIRVSELSLSDLQPSNIRKGFHEANASVVRYCDNLRVVYELEARVRDMRRTDSDSASPSNQPGGSEDKIQPQNGSPNSQPEGDRKNQSPSAAPSGGQPRSKGGPGTSRREPLMPRESRMLAVLGGPLNFDSFYPRDLSSHSAIWGDQFESKGDRS